jgi:hypothetical protein
MTKEPTTFLTIRITRELRHQIREAASKHDQEMAPWVVNAIESYLKFVEPSLPRPNPRPTKKFIEEARKARKIDSSSQPIDKP